VLDDGGLQGLVAGLDGGIWASLWRGGEEVGGKWVRSQRGVWCQRGRGVWCQRSWGVVLCVRLSAGYGCADVESERAGLNAFVVIGQTQGQGVVP
jgi:hypothetical protein